MINVAHVHEHGLRRTRFNIERHQSMIGHLQRNVPLVEQRRRHQLQQRGDIPRDLCSTQVVKQIAMGEWNQRRQLVGLCK